MLAKTAFPSKNSAPQTLDPATRAFVGLSFMSRREVKTLPQLRTFLRDVRAAHDEVLKSGSREQIKRIAELEENGTPLFAMAMQQRWRAVLGRSLGNGSN